MELAAGSYLAIFAGTIFVTWLLTPVALGVALKRQILDHPGSIKAQQSPVPYLGGVAIVVAFSATVMTAALVARPRGGLGELGLILGLAVALSALGLVDDIRSLGPGLRIVAEFVAAILVFAGGISVELFDVVALDAVITVIWIVGIANAFNILDNMDGLSAGIAAISALFFFLIAAVNGQFLVAALSIAVAGCALGFLRHNFHPATIYMGDAGSLFFGFLLAIIGLKLRFEAPAEITFMVPILVLGVPIFDMVLVVVTRTLHRMNPMAGGRDHTSHRLVFVGIPVPVAVALIYGGQVALGWLALIMSRLQPATGFMLMAFVIAIGIFFAVLLGAVPVYEGSKRRRMMLQEVKQHEVEPEVDENGELHDSSPGGKR